MSRVAEQDRIPVIKPSVIFWLPFILQLLIFWSFDLGVDEAHYMLYARHLSLSYFDHPPLIGWIHFLFNSVLGENLLSARLPAMMVGVFSMWQLFLFLKTEGISEEIAKWCTLAMGFCLQFFILHLFFLPETLLIFLIWPLMHTTLCTAKSPSLQSWVWLGIWMGLLGLAKYTAIFFVIPVAIVIYSEQKFSFLKDTGFYLSVFLALAITSPVFIWNYQHDWISFRYQTGHVWGGDDGFKNFFRALIAQVGLYGPFLWPFSIIGFIDLAKQKTLAQKFHFWICIIFIIFFLMSAVKSSMLPHWTALFYLVSLPWGVAKVFSTKSRWAKIFIQLNAGVICLVAALLLSGFAFKIPLAFRDVTGWPELMQQLGSRVQNSNDAVAFTNWTYGSRALYYGKYFENKIFILDGHKGQFGLWNPDLPYAKNLWIVQFSYDEKNLNQIVHCDHLTEKEVLPVISHGAHQYDIFLQECVNAQKPSLP